MRGNQDGTDAEELGAKVAPAAALDIDLEHAQIYGSVDFNNLARQTPDGTNIVPLFNHRLERQPVFAIQLDIEDGYLYWRMRQGIVRARIDSPIEIERVTDWGRETHSYCFAVDTARKKLYWNSENSQTLLCADLPRPWRRVTKQAPPIIESVAPDHAPFGKNVTVRGSGFVMTRKVFWIGSPTGEYVEAQFRILSNTQLTATVPKLAGKCSEATLVVITEGGATVTLPRDSTAIRKTVVVERTAKDQRRAFIVRDAGFLSKPECQVIFIEAGGYADSGARGKNTFFIKNGGKATPRAEGSLVIHEPYAQFSQLPGVQFTQIPVGAIRPSYVDSVFKLGQER
jgi:hypothetical protein